VISQHDAPEYLINHPAITNSNTSLWKISAAEFEQLTAININGVANTIRHFVPSMIEQSWGSVVNLSSGWQRSAAAKVAP